MLTVDFSEFPVLSTERLVLREVETTDAAALLALRSDPRAMLHVGKPLMTSEQEALDLIARIAATRSSNQGIAWAVALRDRPGMIGMMGFHRLVLEHHLAETGYMLSVDHWNLGYVTEALRAILDAGFGRMGFHRIEAITAPANSASRRVLEKCGFRLEGVSRESYRHRNGTFEDSCLYGRLRSDA